MSLINQMLRDLEKRNHVNNPQQPLDIKVSELSTKKPGSLFLIIPIAVSLSIFMIFQHYITRESPKERRLTGKPAPEIIHQMQPGTATALLSPATIVEKAAKKSPTNKKTTKTVAKKKAYSKQKPTHPGSIQKAAAQPKTFKGYSPREQAEKLFLQIQQTDLPSIVRSNLEQVLNLDPMHLKARILLAQILLKQGLKQQTADFLDQSLQLFPENLLFIKTRAQIYLQQKNHVAALKILNTRDTSSINDPTYLSLLAAAYQQQGNFKQSVNIYQRLVTLSPNTAQYWLGLAIALENTGTKQQAVTAYQQAIDKNTLKSAIIHYINQRITALR